MNFLTLTLLVSLYYEAIALNLPGPQVYVVTAAPKNLQIDEGRSAPQSFYYHNWKRMDSLPDTTTIKHTPGASVKTPDLIFAEFEADEMKNIRKLLEKERIESKPSTTTSQPIFVLDEDKYTQMINPNPGSPTEEKEKEEKTDKKDMTDYFALYNNLYNINTNVPAPIYLPSTTSTTTTVPKTTSTSIPSVHNVENIWEIIDSEKRNQYSGKWDEVPISLENNEEQYTSPRNQLPDSEGTDDNDTKIDENFALPGFGTTTKGAENESRAIRTEPNVRFPYVNLKPFQMKNLQKPLINGEKGNNMYSLDNFFDLKKPARGEAQDEVASPKQIDRYNPAQPYLPSEYGSNSKQSSSSKPSKTVANLVPPPPPPPPKITGSDFPAPVSYDSFPPYSPLAPDSGPPVLAPINSMLQSPVDSSDDSDSSGPGADDSDNDGPPTDLGYRYKPPAPPAPAFVPTIPPPPKKPSGGFRYNKPPMMDDASLMADKPDFQGYSYNKPVVPDEGYHYSKPAPLPEKPFNGYLYNKPLSPTMVEDASPMDDKPDFQGYGYNKPMPAPAVPDKGYHYNKPEPPTHVDTPISYGQHGPISYGHHGPPSYSPDYPELIYDNPHNSMSDTKGGGGMKDDDMGMVPPPAPEMKPGMENSPPMDDSGFPQDFPGDFKFHGYDDHDHDFYHHHHHHTTTTTTTTTETPRVNRFSYYYLGKKLYYLPLYFSVYFIVYVGALIIKAVLRHKIVYPNSFRPNDDTASFFSKRSVDSWDLSNENLHQITGNVTHAIATAAEKYMNNREIKNE